MAETDKQRRARVKRERQTAREMRVIERKRKAAKAKKVRKVTPSKVKGKKPPKTKPKTIKIPGATVTYTSKGKKHKASVKGPTLKVSAIGKRSRPKTRKGFTVVKRKKR